MSTMVWPDSRALAEARGELATAMLSRIPLGEQTLILQLLARGFVTAYADALSNRRPEAVVDWVDRMCEAHADRPAVAHLFAGACESLDHSLGGERFGETYRDPLRRLREAMRATAAKPRRAPATAVDRFDEVDAAINEAVMRLDRADPLTAEHSRAVGAWCARIGRRLGLSERETTFVSRCGMIHDIGKITTPTTILHAPRSLDDGEWKIMRDHTLAGEAIVLESSLLSEFAPAVRSHHERLDGRGYPDRIAGEEIGLFIRIVTVADCFNAMIGRRPYRPSMPPARALEQLRVNAGAQFDPAIVDAMHAVVGGSEPVTSPGRTDS